MAKKITQEQMLEAIKNSQGLVSKIQRHLKAITGENICWESTERFIHKWEATEAAVRAEKEAMLDVAENQIYKELLNGDTATAKWYLKMKGKERGYEETPTVMIGNDDPLNINLAGSGQMSPAELMNASNVELGGIDERTEESNETSATE